MNHDVFISYSSRNKYVADAVVHCLEENKIRCWIAPRDIIGGAEYADVITDAIKYSKIFILVYSEYAAISRFCKQETNLALSSGKVIIPFKIDSSQLSGSMEFYLNDKHWIDAFPNPEEHFGSLLASVKSVLSGSISLSPVTELFKPTNKYLRLVQVLFSAVFGMLGAVGTYITIGSYKIDSKWYSELSPWMRYTYTVVMPLLFLAGVWLSCTHPIATLKGVSFKKLRSFASFGAILNTFVLVLRVVISWFLIIIGIMQMLCGPIMVVAKFINKPVVDVVVILGILSLGVPVFCVGLPIFKAGWALIDRNYAKFSFTPKKLLKWILVILIPCLLYGILISLFPSLNMDFWDHNGQSEVPTITDEALNAFRNSKWKEGVELSVTADRTNPELQFYLGLCYERGWGGLYDWSEAAHWYRLSAEQGNASSQCNLGLMFEKGMGISANEDKAFEWYTKASSNGSHTAKAFLADMLENGKGVECDVEEAYRLYSESATKGNEFARYAVDRMSLPTPHLSAADDAVKMMAVSNILTSVAFQTHILDICTDVWSPKNPVLVLAGTNIVEVIENNKTCDALILSPGTYSVNGEIRIARNIAIFGMAQNKNAVVIENVGFSSVRGKHFGLVNVTIKNTKERRWLISNGIDVVIGSCDLNNVSIHLGNGSKNVIMKTSIIAQNNSCISVGKGSVLLCEESNIAGGGTNRSGIYCSEDSKCLINSSDICHLTTGIRTCEGATAVVIDTRIKDVRNHFIGLSDATQFIGLLMEMDGCRGGDVCSALWLGNDSKLYLAGSVLKNVDGEAIRISEYAISTLVNCDIVEVKECGRCYGRLRMYGLDNFRVITSDDGSVEYLTEKPYVPEMFSGRLSKENIQGTITIE